MADEPDFARRKHRHGPALDAALHGLYGARADFPAWLAALHARLAAKAAERAPRLRARDLDAEADTAWFLRSSELGYSCYVDRFAGTLARLRGRIPYLRDLGITYLHLLPFWDVADGDNDGGFAVRNYRKVQPRLGHTDDIAPLCEALSEAGITLCADLVLNHTADTHPWALAARAGEPAYRDYYHIIASRAEMEAYQRTLPDIFPKTAPGSFTYVPDVGGWVWTTFYPFQWDLNYANPAVFGEMADLVLDLANLGIGAFRLDSAAFLWKRLGTDCRSQMETHLVIRALRAVIDIAAPAVLLKSEVIAPVTDAAAYLGSDAGPECHLAYHAGLMTAGWAALAEQDASTARAVLDAVPSLPAGAGWITYVRCHDDIGWQPLAPQAGAAKTGADPASVQRRLRRISDFYTDGLSFARGAAFQSGAGDAAHGINGTAGSLAGLDGAATAAETGAAIARLSLLYGLAYAAGGLPVIYMGDELGQLNDRSFEIDTLRAHDGRWLHRPLFDSAAAEVSANPESLPGRVRTALAALASARAHLPALSPATLPRPLPQASNAVLAFSRGADWLILLNFAAAPCAAALPGRGSWRDVLTGTAQASETMILPAYGMAWLTRESG
jgi:amylosucrase